MSGRECALIATAAAGAAAVLGFRAGLLAAKADWRITQETSPSAGAEAPAPAPAAPPQAGGEGVSDFSDWEQAVPPRDS